MREPPTHYTLSETESIDAGATSKGTLRIMFSFKAREVCCFRVVRSEEGLKVYLESHPETQLDKKDEYVRRQSVISDFILSIF